MKKLIGVGAFFCLILTQPQLLQASHIRAADVIVEPVCGTTYTYNITVTAYLNSASGTLFGSHGTIYFGDGSTLTMSGITATARPDLGDNVSVATYTTTHTYSSAGTYTISYLENHRNEGILNIDDSKDVAYVSSVTVIVNSTNQCNHYPVLSIPPVDRGCSGVIFYHSPGAYDEDGDSLSYELTIPKATTTTSAGYTAPNDASFYTNYNTGNEAGTGTPTFGIDAYTGLVTWDAPGAVGEYNIAFEVVEWRKNSSGTYTVLSTTVRDMQIVIEDCDNNRPELTLPADTCVVAGTTLEATITGTDPDNDAVKIEVISQVLELDESPATFSPEPAFTSTLPASVTFTWNTVCAHVRQQAYQVVFRITDDPDDGASLVTYQTWEITVIAPAPTWTDATLDVTNRASILTWDAYTCTEADSMQVWRRVDSYAYTPGYCDIGLPGYAGYHLIATVPITETTYTDTDLAPGAKYCYRLVALINDTKSYVSEEACVGPIGADAPVITHVSVKQTALEGAIDVSWRNPFDIDTDQFPPPYEYEVYRANDYIGDDNLQLASDRIQDTTFVDTGINTLEDIFNYRIVLYAIPTGSADYAAVDTSAVASSVRLAGTSGDNSITLVWRDTVPWSNTVQEHPYHLIYRGEGYATEDDLVLIDSIDVTTYGFNYVDEGQHSFGAPSSDELYTYRVRTRGTYGNPDIALQENYSQMIALYPNTDLQTCAPSISMSTVDCDQYVQANTCTQTDFSNTLSWTPVTSEGCRIDIAYYNLYAADDEDGTYELLASIDATTYTETGLSSYARCYRLAAVTTQGEEGTLSDPICNDNCPYYALPNFFSPNDDGCNDVFSAYGQADADGGCQEVVNVYACPRFVTKIAFTVFNRWGHKVYTYHSGENKSVYINWNGKDDNGNNLGTGVYYYRADVTFDVVDDRAKHQTLKGWIQLAR